MYCLTCQCGCIRINTYLFYIDYRNIKVTALPNDILSVKYNDEIICKEINRSMSAGLKNRYVGDSGYKPFFPNSLLDNKSKGLTIQFCLRIRTLVKNNRRKIKYHTQVSSSDIKKFINDESDDNKQ